MKIRIIGACGSGKTYLAKKLSKTLEIKYYETDNIIWDRKINQKRPLESRNHILAEIIAKESWIIEGAQYRWSSESFDAADIIIVLNPHPFVRESRVVRRYLSMQFGIGSHHYRQNFRELIDMIKQNREFDSHSFGEILKSTERYRVKRFIHRDICEIMPSIEQMIRKLQNT